MQEQQTIDSSTIRGFIVETFLFGDGSDLDDDTSFMETGLIDSMGILKVADFIERIYGIKLQPDQFIPENLDSVANIARFVSYNIPAEALDAEESD
jgi:acyl carrier protein